LAGDKFYQLTWQNNVIFVYDRDFNELKKVDYPHQGWGLTFDGTHLIASDGTRLLYFLDPETLEEVKKVKIHMTDRSVGNVNEMEVFGDDIYANVYQTDELYWIDKNTGKVQAIIDLSGLWPRSQRKGHDEVLNGIAFDPATKRIWVTGKYAPHVWEIELTDKLLIVMVLVFAVVALYLASSEQLRTLGTVLLVALLAGGIYFGFRWSKEAAENDPESPVIVAKRHDEMQAAVVVSQLEAEGINAVAVGTFTSGFQVEIASMVKIVVPRRQADQAREILLKDPS